MIEITAVPRSNRSATGSRTLPRVDTWCQRRATNPSIQSVAPKAASNQAAGCWRWAPKRIQTKIGRQRSRTSVIALGAVRTRSSPAAASVSGCGSGPVEATGPSLRSATCSAAVRASGPRPRPSEARAGVWKSDEVPRFEPFVGLRYDPARVSLDQVIAPPYDIIEPKERGHLAARHAANAVHVELPEADLRAGIDRYQVAAGLLAAWQADGILRADPAPAFYPYPMITPDGTSSTGVIGALGIDDAGDDVLPHEETLPKPKSDRYDLLSATRANLS